MHDWPYLEKGEEVPLAFYAAAGAPVGLGTLRARHNDDAISTAERSVQGSMGVLERGAQANWGVVERYSELQTRTMGAGTPAVCREVAGGVPVRGCGNAWIA